MAFSGRGHERFWVKLALILRESTMESSSGIAMLVACPGLFGFVVAARLANAWQQIHRTRGQIMSRMDVERNSMSVVARRASETHPAYSRAEQRPVGVS